MGIMIEKIQQPDKRELGIVRTASGMVNGEIVFNDAPGNIDTPQEAVTVIRDESNAKLTTIELTAKMQALEAQISELSALNERLQLERAQTLQAGKPTTEIAVKQFDCQQNIEVFRATIHGLQMDMPIARKREKISELERVTADLLGSKNTEAKAYEHLIKALAGYKEVLNRFDRQQREYECIQRDLAHEYHLSMEVINKHGQKNEIDELTATVEEHRVNVYPQRSGIVFAGGA